MYTCIMYRERKRDDCYETENVKGRERNPESGEGGGESRMSCAERDMGALVHLPLPPSPPPIPPPSPQLSPPL